MLFRSEVQFSTYAVPMIMGEIKRFLRDDGMVKVSRSLKENGWKIRRAAESLGQELGREATLQEISDVTQISLEDIVAALEANIGVESIYKSVYQSDGSEIFLVDQVVSGGRIGCINQKDNIQMGNHNAFGECYVSNNFDVEKEELLNHMLIEQLLAELDDTERELIVMRYIQDKTQVEIAKNLGISQVQVSRMEKKILVRMRNRIIKHEERVK